METTNFIALDDVQLRGFNVDSGYPGLTSRIPNLRIIKGTKFIVESLGNEYQIVYGGQRRVVTPHEIGLMLLRQKITVFKISLRKRLEEKPCIEHIPVTRCNWGGEYTDCSRCGKIL